MQFLQGLVTTEVVTRSVVITSVVRIVVGIVMVLLRNSVVTMFIGVVRVTVVGWVLVVVYVVDPPVQFMHGAVTVAVMTRSVVITSVVRTVVGTVVGTVIVLLRYSVVGEGIVVITVVGWIWVVVKVVDPPVQFLHGSVTVRMSVVKIVVGTVIEIVWLRYSVVGDGIVVMIVVGWI